MNINDVKCSLDACDAIIDSIQRQLYSNNALLGATNSAYEVMTEAEKAEYKELQRKLRDYIKIKNDLLDEAASILSGGGGGGGGDIPEISTDIEADKDSDDKTASAKAVYDFVEQELTDKADKILIETEQPSGGMLSNTLYNFGELKSDTTFTMAAATDSTIVNVWDWTFEIGATTYTIIWPSEIKIWLGGAAPTINSNKHYEINVMDGYATFIEYDLPTP